MALSMNLSIKTREVIRANPDKAVGLAPKAHVSYMELAGALHTFLKSRNPKE